MEGKNSYFESFKNEMTQTKNKEKAWVNEQKDFSYDRNFAHYDHKIAGSTLYENRCVAKPVKNITDAKAE